MNVSIPFTTIPHGAETLAEMRERHCQERLALLEREVGDAVLAVKMNEVTPIPEPKMADCVAAVERVTGIPVAVIRGPKRTKEVALARQFAMWQLHRAGYSLPRIGRFLGNRDHSTVLHGVRRIKQRLGEAGAPLRYEEQAQ